MARSVVEQQLARVRRALFLDRFLAHLGWAWVAALGLASLWVLVQPFLVQGPVEWLRWGVAGGLVVLATLAGLILALRRYPDSTEAALALDERFVLHERITTAIGMSAAEASTPAGQAVLADAEARAARLSVRQGFPLRFRRGPLLLVPVGALCLVLLTLLWNPDLSARSADDPEPQFVNGSKADLEEQMQRLVAKKSDPRPPREPAPPEALQRIQDDIEAMSRAPRKTREDLRDRVRDATALEEEIRRQQKQQTDRNDALREQMEQLQRLTRKKREAEQGPARAAGEALARADMEKAGQELQKLGKDLEKPPAGDKQGEKEREKQREKDRENLAKQLEQMEDDLKRLARNRPEQEKELRDRAERGEMDRDQLDRELDQLERNAERLAPQQKALEELAKQLGECKQCLREGKEAEAVQKLAEAGKACANKAGEQEGMARKLAEVQEARKALCRALGEGVGAGRRPETKDETNHKEELLPGVASKSKIEVTGQGPMGGFKGPRRPADLKDEIRQAAQEAPAALDRQRLPGAARKLARDYFERVREPEKKKQ